uniref:Uncharacterized protein n=1 Tax=Astyanax mexicanus TaxID=7994 RepID=A0A3B1K182_ASTMX
MVPIHPLTDASCRPAPPLSVMGRERHLLNFVPSGRRKPIAELHEQDSNLQPLVNSGSALDCRTTQPCEGIQHFILFFFYKFTNMVSIKHLIHKTGMFHYFKETHLSYKLGLVALY